ncbi:MAG: hypothetical protein ABI782_08395, partial [Anaerolineaceae bacterium]
LGDGRQWDQVRFNYFPSHAAFEKLRANPIYQAGQPARGQALEDTYTMMVIPSRDRFAASTRMTATPPPASE